MRQAGGASWQIEVCRGDLLCDVALWIRAAERLDVPSDSIVPGPLDIDRLPSPTADLPVGLGVAWLEWWRLVVFVSARSVGMHSPPDFRALSQRANLRGVVAQRWEEATKWHTSRILKERRADPHHIRGREISIVQDVERSLGREVDDFSLRFVLLPVRESIVRQVTNDLYLVPERFHDGPEWQDWLGDLVRRIG